MQSEAAMLSPIGPEAGAVSAAQATPPSEASTALASVQAKPFVPLITFDQWFASLPGRRPHHIHGMRAFANTSGRMAASAWAERFAAY